MKAIRALVLVLLGWASLRSFALFISTSSAEPDMTAATPAITPAIAVAEPAGRAPGSPAMRQPARSVGRSWQTQPVVSFRSTVPNALAPRAVQQTLVPVEAYMAPLTGALGARLGENLIPQTTELPSGTPADIASKRRLALSSWSILRPATSRVIIAENGQLGGSQAGFRLWVPPIASFAGLEARPTLRMSSTVQGSRQREAAIGFALRPAGSETDVQLIAERRLAIGKGGRNAFAVLAAAGASRGLLNDAAQFEGYAQAGLVGLRRKDLFAEGAATLTRNAMSAGSLSIAAGGGIWAGAQPGLSRVDVGPSLVARIKAGPATLRAQLDWRLRAAGEAAPQSGPALSIGLSI